ncbi:ABC transporter substrate-binding protein [Lampropedia cohaerens]|uniref:ABC transporter substrate-binding protein n=1 Tax=Lampropedia cohaerens TaxID=1610491 RepID=A0A0U1Q051_9BURK|nr:transporter substrate-binding domain-containing protein [Lampropedia cohaerens]KKW68111.1 ABC transporter substrate-binding protein [Lampropedia cohaerens]
MSVIESLKRTFAPTGTLRASINLGNAVLAGRDPITGAAVGVSVDLANALAERLGLPLDLVTWETAAQSVEAVVAGQADFGFFAIDPKRGEQIAFTPPYVLIEGSYLVRENAPLHSNDEVDRAGITITVGQGSAYDLYLSRTLKQATIARAPSSPAVVEYFLQHGHDAAAGVRPQIAAEAARLGGLRLLPGRFMVIRQAMGLRRDRGMEAAAFLSQFVEDMKACGMVDAALQRHRITGAEVAPAGE